MMRRIAVISVLGLAYISSGLSAKALSCKAYTPEASYAFHDASEDEYHIYQGRIKALEQIPRSSDGRNVGVSANVRAIFEGKGLGPNGLNARASSFPLTVKIHCSGSWCGGFPSQNENIYFFKLEIEGGYKLTMGPCGGSLFQATQEIRSKLVDCFAHGCSHEPEGDASLPTPAPRPIAPPSPIKLKACGKEYLGGILGLHVSELPPYLSESRNVRIIPKGGPVTMDYRPSRLNIELNNNSEVERIRCG